MIRKAQINDFDRINELGSILDVDFINKNDLNNYISNGIYLFNVLEVNDIVEGFILATKLYETIEILYIIINEDYQKCGYGKQLIDSISVDNSNILLEVRSSNKNAIDFYQHLNFKIINTRKKYYENGDDALIMERSI